MPKVVITGHTRGIGKDLWNHFATKGWHTVGFNSKNSFEEIIKESIGCDLFINNSYANGKQIEFLNQLYSNVKRMIVCGSIAAFNPDVTMPEYSDHKIKLAQRVKQLQHDGVQILMFHLTSNSYNDPQALVKLIDVWLEHPHITEIGFDYGGEPNG